MMHTNTLREQVSSLADGDLPSDEVAALVAKVVADDALRDTWRTYHLVGDVLRSGVHSSCSDTETFLAKFQDRLAAEPLVPVIAVEVARLPQRRVEAANEPVFRWKLVAGAASLAAAAAIGWNWVGIGDGAGARSNQVQLARQEPQQQQLSNSVLAASTSSQQLTATRVAVGNGNPQVMLRDPRLDQLLEAHRQAGGASQMPSTFLRDATFEGPSR